MNASISEILGIALPFVAIIVVVLVVAWDFNKRAKLATALNAKAVLIPPGLKGQYEGKAFEVCLGGRWQNFSITIFQHFPFEVVICKKGSLNAIDNFIYGRSDLPKVENHLMGENAVYTSDAAMVGSFFRSANNKGAIDALFEMGFNAIIISRQKNVVNLASFNLAPFFELESFIKKSLKHLNSIS